MRSTVGAAVLAGALVFSGTAANAQPVPADDSAATAQIEQAAPEAVQSAPAPAPAPADAPSTPVSPAAPADENPGTDAPAGEPATDPADAATDATSPEAEQLPAAEGPTGDEAPVDASAEAPTEEPAEVQPVAPAAESLPAGQVAPPAAKTAATEKTAAKEKAAPAPLPGAGTITIPEGAAEWTTEQWNDWASDGKADEWLEANEKPLKEAMESEDFAAFADSVIPFLIEGDPDALKAYLDATYPDDAVLAQLMLGVLIGQLIEEGILDEDGFFIGELVPGDEDPAEETEGGTDEPSGENDGEAVIEPVANITKPKTPTTKPVEAFTPIKVPSGQLAETGAEGTILLAGAGGGMLLLGVGALALRRRKQA